MKRTKRYGGFLVGDRVKVKETAKCSAKGSGRVMAYNGAKIVVESYPMEGMIEEFMPNQLINLTRQEEEEQELHEKTQFPWTSKEKQKQIENIEELLGLNKRCTFPFLYIKNPKAISQDDFMKEFNPTPYVDLITCSIKEREEKLRKLAEQELCETYGVEQPLVDNPSLEPEPTTEEMLKWMCVESENETPYPNPSPYPNCYTCTLDF